LSRYSGRDDVLFGATVSGRSAPLAGIEKGVGLFINAVPVRVRVEPEAVVRTWLLELQQQQADARHYSYAPLFELQRWSELPAGLPMFESLMAFENFPVDHSAIAKQKTSLRVRELQLKDSTNYPLTIVAIPGPELTLRIDYETARFDPESISRLLDRLQAVLDRFVKQPESRLFDIDLDLATELPSMGDRKQKVAPLSDAEWKILNE
jgi:non-ribosomal peptide synthetase component F